MEQAHDRLIRLMRATNTVKERQSWDKIIKLTTVDEGDLAMLIFRTADNLRQITSLADTHPELAKKARKSIDLILKEPVIIPF